MDIEINVQNRTLSCDENTVINYNSDYALNFTFDEAWSYVKTLRIINDVGAYKDIPFMGNSVNLPAVNNTKYIAIGLFTDNIRSTTPLIIKCQGSIVDSGDTFIPDEDTYRKIIELLNKCIADIDDLEIKKLNISDVVDDLTTEEPQKALSANQGKVLKMLADQKVDKVEGKGLSANDYTDTEKQKLAGIEEGAEVNTVTSVNGKTGEVVITKADVKLRNVDDTSDMNKPISKATQEALDEKADKATTLSGYGITDAYTKSESDTKLNEKADKTSVYDKPTSDNRYLPKGTVSGVIPQTKFSVISDAINYQIWGNSVQNGTPSPDNPVEIQSVGDLVTDETSEYYGKYKIPIKVCGNNLLNINTFEPYKTGRITIDGDTITYNGSWYISNDINLKAGTTVTCSFNMTGYDATASASNKWRIQYADGTYSPTYMDSGDNISLIKDASKIMIYVSQGVSVSATISDIQLEFGTVATEYEQFREEIINIYLDEPLRKIGAFADYIDFLRGKVIRKIKKRVFNGKENWTNYPTGVNQYGFYSFMVYMTDGIISSDISMFSNYYFYINTPFLRTDKISCLYSNKSLCFRDNNFTNVNDFKAWLSEKNTNGESLIALYVLDIPIEESIILEPLPLQDGINNIITETTIQPSNVVVEYYQNPSDLFNEIIKIIRGDNMGRTEEQLDNMIALTNQLVKQNETIIKQTAQKAEEEK